MKGDKILEGNNLNNYRSQPESTEFLNQAPETVVSGISSFLYITDPRIINCIKVPEWNEKGYYNMSVGNLAPGKDPYFKGNKSRVCYLSISFPIKLPDSLLPELPLEEVLNANIRISLSSIYRLVYNSNFTAIQLYECRNGIKNGPIKTEEGIPPKYGNPDKSEEQNYLGNYINSNLQKGKEIYDPSSIRKKNQDQYLRPEISRSSLLALYHPSEIQDLSYEEKQVYFLSKFDELLSALKNSQIPEPIYTAFFNSLIIEYGNSLNKESLEEFKNSNVVSEGKEDIFFEYITGMLSQIVLYRYRENAPEGAGFNTQEANILFKLSTNSQMSSEVLHPKSVRFILDAQYRVWREIIQSSNPSSIKELPLSIQKMHVIFKAIVKEIIADPQIDNSYKNELKAKIDRFTTLNSGLNKIRQGVNEDSLNELIRDELAKDKVYYYFDQSLGGGYISINSGTSRGGAVGRGRRIKEDEDAALRAQNYLVTRRLNSEYYRRMMKYSWFRNSYFAFKNDQKDNL